MNVLDTGTPAAMTVDADRRLIVVGTGADVAMNNAVFAIARLLPDGTPDTTFGVSGTGVVLAIPPSGNTWSAPLTSVAIDSKGRIVVGGSCYVADAVGDADMMVVARFLPDGSPDLSFGDRGYVETTSGDRHAGVLSVAIDNADRILAAGFSIGATADATPIVVRYKENGGVDTTFGKHGTADVPYASFVSSVKSMVFDATGNIVISGRFYDSADFAFKTFVGRLADDGAPDATFGPDGSGYLVNADIQGEAAAIDASGRVLIAGGGNDDTPAVARFDATGQLDLSFGRDGTGIVTVGSDAGITGEARSIAFDSSGSIAMSGFVLPYAGGFTEAAVIRFNPDGTLDDSFGTDGIAIAEIDPAVDFDGVGMVLVDDEATISAASDSSSYQFTLARFGK